jgi:hypothetical protein
MNDSKTRNQFPWKVLLMDEYLCLTVRSNANETEAEFKSRLTAFWSMMLREHEAEFEKVYAETVAFEQDGKVLTRQYLLEAEVAEQLTAWMTTAQIAFNPLDFDDTYSKYEAQPPEWFWIEH